jgi:GntR family transcriptional repressor for pyruvate dehydrogenase complex
VYNDITNIFMEYQLSAMLTKKIKISEMIIEEMKRMLRDGELKEGDKLPNQYEFADQLGVSRPSLREALNQLSILGVVEQKPGAGTILKSGNPDLWFEQPSPPMLDDSEATLELLEARKKIESIAIELAAERINKKDIKDLDVSIRKMEDYYKNDKPYEYYKEDINFHYLIAKSSHNRYILQTIVYLKILMGKFMRESFEVIPNLLQNSLEHHRAILLALKNRDKIESIKEIQNHINDIESQIKDYYKRT